MSKATERSLLWPDPEQVRENELRPEIVVDSPRSGGPYRIDTSVAMIHPLNALPRDVAIKLTSWIYDHNRFGIECPEITEEVINKILTARPFGINERVERLLRRLRSEQPRIGRDCEPLSDAFLAASESIDWQELRELWHFARDQGLVDVPGDQSLFYRTDEANNIPVCLTVRGHAWLESLDAQNADSDQGFVAMWFDPLMNDVFAKGFAPAIEDAGFKPMRVDRHEYEGKIDDEVIAQIRRSRFVVVDLTSAIKDNEAIVRGSVYYEAGFAGGLGLPVIWTAANDMPEAHFDVRQFNILQWDRDNLPDLRTRLARRISAVVGDGPHGYRPPEEDKED